MDSTRLYGVDYALLQENKPGEWQLVLCGSWFLADVDAGYVIIESELVEQNGP